LVAMTFFFCYCVVIRSLSSRECVGVPDLARKLM
jgi:hypothetical protein